MLFNSLLYPKFSRPTTLDMWSTLYNQTDRDKLELRKDGYNLLLFFE